MSKQQEITLCWLAIFGLTAILNGHLASGNHLVELLFIDGIVAYCLWIILPQALPTLKTPKVE